MKALPLGLRYYLYAVDAAAILLLCDQTRKLLAQSLDSVTLLMVLVFLPLAYFGARVGVPVKTSLTVTQSTAIYVAVAFLFPPPFAVWIACIAALTSPTISFGKDLSYKHVYNLCHDVLTVGLSAVLIHDLALPRELLHPPSPIMAPLAGLAILALYIALDAGLTVAVFSLLRREAPWRVWWTTLRHTFPAEVGTANFGLLLAIAWTYQPALVCFFVGPLVMLHGSARAFGRAVRRGVHLEAVLLAAQRVQPRLGSAGIVGPIIQAARTIVQHSAIDVYLRNRQDPTTLDLVEHDPNPAYASPVHASPPPRRLSVSHLEGQLDATAPDQSHILLVPIRHGDVGVVGSLRVTAAKALPSQDERDALS